MFTGLIEEIGVVSSLTSSIIGIKCEKIYHDTKLGDSVAINGVCLSVIKKESNILTFNISPTTKAHTNFKAGATIIGDKINLERALLLTSRLGGHIVTGHVDGVARIINIINENEFKKYEFQVPSEFRAFIAAKGSIALDGISLTVSSLQSSSFEVAVIPQTLSDTTLAFKKIGQFVHFEIDVMARYINQLLKFNGSKDLGSPENFTFNY